MFKAHIVQFSVLEAGEKKRHDQLCTILAADNIHQLHTIIIHEDSSPLGYDIVSIGE
jgi:hypothetical protein